MLYELLLHDKFYMHNSFQRFDVRDYKHTQTLLQSQSSLARGLGLL